MGLYKDDVGNIKGVYTSKNFMAQLKVLLDEYAKENQPFYLWSTIRASTVPASKFYNKDLYDIFRDYTSSHRISAINFDSGSNGYMMLADVTPIIKDGGGIILQTSNPEKYSYVNTSMLNGKWEKENPKYDRYKWGLSNGEFSINLTENAGVFVYLNFYFTCDPIWNGSPSIGNFVTTDGGRMRVFKTQADFMNYSVGQRKIYYTSEYYNYVPEDLSVSIDELQKTIEDMQDVIDKLLEQITDQTDESEIEELLKQILEELRNQQGGGGGSGGGGDVNVDIDLSTTNSLLSKILAKVTQIFEKMNAAVEDAEQTALAKIQESLDEIIVQLKKIKRWTAIDTVVDGVDAIADWLDLIRGVLKDAKEGAGAAVASLSSAVGDSVDLMAKKFPFSIPWDILFFVSVLSAEPQVPHFEIPFNIELSALDITIDYTMELDFSQLQWLSDLSRLLLSMTYGVGLMKLTFGVTSVGKEE